MASRKHRKQQKSEAAAAGGTTLPLAPHWRRHDVVAALGLVLLTLLALGRIVTFDFCLWDDTDTIARNPWLNPPTGAGLAAAWTTPRMDLWVPLTYSAWWVIAHVAQRPPAPGTGLTLSPGAFHAANLLLHVAAVVVTFALLRRLRMPAWPAAVGAAVFAVHPVQVESVAWASGTKDVLSGLLSLAAVYAYVAAVDRDPDRRRVRWGAYAAAAALLVLAMLAKPQAMVVPAIAGVIDWLLVGRPVRRVVATAAPLLMLAMPFMIVAKLVQPAHESAGQQVAIYLRPLIASDTIAFYLGKIVWPARLAIDYGRTPAAAAGNGWAYWTWVVPAAAVAVAVFVRRRTIMPLAALGVFVAALGPVLGLVRTDFQAISTVADHYLYVAMLGVSLLVAWAMTKASGRGWTVAAGVVISVLAIRSFVQAGVWRDTPTLFAHALTVNPDSVGAHTNLAYAAAQAGRTDEAIAHARRAVELRPTSVKAVTTLGAQHLARGELDVAAGHFRSALRMAPDDPYAMSNLAAALGQQGRVDEALPLARRAAELGPELAQARLNYAVVLANTGRPDLAVGELQAAVRLDPADANAATNLAILFAEANRPAEAVAELRRILAVRPDHAPARQVLAQLTGGRR